MNTPRLLAGRPLTNLPMTPPAGPLALVVRLAVTATVTESGYLHAKLYINGYRFIPHIGVMFLLQSAVSFAVAALVLLGGPILVQLAAAGTALGALGGFVLSRTTGIWGFTERGLQPHPDALLSVLSETATLVLLTALWTYTLHHHRTTTTHTTPDTTTPTTTHTTTPSTSTTPDTTTPTTSTTTT